MGDFVVAFKCNFYLGAFEEVCDFSDLWRYVKVVHLVLFLDSMGVVVWVILCCICCLNLIIRNFGKMLFLAISSMVVHSLCWCSLQRGRVNILSSSSGRLRVCVLVGGWKNS